MVVNLLGLGLATLILAACLTDTMAILATGAIVTTLGVRAFAVYKANASINK